MWKSTHRTIRKRPGLIGLMALGITLIALLAADMVLPRLIADAYAGSGPARLTRFFDTRRGRHTLDHYLTLWREFRDACLIAAVAYGALAALIERSIGPVRLQAALLVFSAMFLATTVLSGPRQDYVAHLKIWDEVSAGHDPWWIQPGSGIVLNAYGPLFETLAPVAKFNPLGPKILFATCYLIYAVIMALRAEQAGFESSKSHWLMIIWLANPFFWLEIAFYGHFDVLAGLLVASALAAFGHGAMLLAGGLVGLGFLLKFVPAVVVPFMGFERAFTNRFRIRPQARFLAASIGVMAGGMAAALVIWGSSALRPLAFVSTRGSSLLAIWRYLKGPNSPLTIGGNPPPDLDRFATPVLLAALGFVWLITLRKRFEPVHSCFCALLTTLTFYRVGFVQYQMFVILLIPSWYFLHRESLASRRFSKLSLIVYVVWITAFDLFDNAVGGIVGFERPWAWLEDWVGLPHFILGIWLLTNLLNFPAVRAIGDSRLENETAG